jgi:tetrahydromethanopterin S-methyltransferase subunit E
LHPRIKLALVVSFCIAGALLVNYALSLKLGQVNAAFSRQKPVDANLVILRQLCLFFGFLFLIVSLGYAYISTLLSHDMMRSEHLKIVDFALFGMCILLMPIFELIGILPWIWVATVVFPCIAARLVIAWWIQGAKGHD